MNVTRNTGSPLVISGLILILFGCSLQGAIIYVDADAAGANTGTSWADAYTYLQDALADADTAPKPVEIWVAEGIYKPDRNYENPIGTGDRTASFQLINDVALYGGFPDGGGIWENRDPDAYETILSGDIGAPIDPNDNCYHVFYHPSGLNLNETAILDGFTITAGNANATVNPDYCGGGMYNDFGNPMVTECAFINNSAELGGGGIYNSYSDPEIYRCRFHGNRANLDGGGIYNFQSSPMVTSCVLINNSSLRFGGGMNNYSNSNPTVIDTKFLNNSTTLRGDLSDFSGGAGIYNGYSNPKVSDCTFIQNVTIGVGSNRGGGGMYNRYSNPLVSDCIFNENLAESDGGAIKNYISGPVLNGCKFIKNSASSGGALSSYTSSSPVVNNCVFKSNIAALTGGAVSNGVSSYSMFNSSIFTENSARNGGGVFNGWESNPTLVNCTFFNNSAEQRGGGIFNNFTCVSLTNCIVWKNVSYGAQIFLDSDSSVFINWCNIQGGQDSIYIEDNESTINWGEGNIDEEPLLTPDGHLRSGLSHND